MINPKVILILATISSIIWIGGESVKGLKWVKHHTKEAIHHIVHPHNKDKK